MKVSESFEIMQMAMLQDRNSPHSISRKRSLLVDMTVFKLALRNVAEAHLGSIGAFAEHADLNRIALYRSLSERGSPILETLTCIMRALDLRISAVAGKASSSEL